MSRPDIEAVAVVALSVDREAETLPSGVNAAGLELYPANARPCFRELIEAVERTRPTHLIVAAPVEPLTRWGFAETHFGLPMVIYEALCTGAPLIVRSPDVCVA